MEVNGTAFATLYYSGDEKSLMIVITTKLGSLTLFVTNYLGS